jgi:2-C-methyl-D-erythritol 4-phosphate cytidylyltransferase
MSRAITAWLSLCACATGLSGPRWMTMPQPRATPANETDRMREATAALVLAPVAVGRGAFSPCWADLLGRPVFAWSVDALDGSPMIADVILVVPAGRLSMARELVGTSGWHRVRPIAVPRTARTPAAQIRAGLEGLGSACDTIVLHDGSRPLLAPAPLANLLHRADEESVIVAAAPVKETIKWADDAGMVRLTPPRSTLWQLGTPVVVPRSILEAAVSGRHPTHVEEDTTPSALSWLLEACPARHVRLARTDDSDFLVRSRADLEVAAGLIHARDVGGMRANGRAAAALPPTRDPEVL